MIPNIENYMIEIFLLLAIIFMSFIDLKNKEFPAPLTSGILLIVALTNFGNIHFGILAFILSVFLLDMETFSGMADVKLVTAIGFMIPNLGLFFVFIIVLLLFSTVYQILMIKILKKRQGDDYPFIPVLFFTYVTLLLIMVL